MRCEKLFESPSLIELIALERTLTGWPGGSPGHVLAPSKKTPKVSNGDDYYKFTRKTSFNS
jgi:hypothetical protein